MTAASADHLRAGGARTRRPVRAVVARCRDVAWHHPEWTVALACATAWALLLTGWTQPVRAAAHSVSHTAAEHPGHRALAGTDVPTLLTSGLTAGLAAALMTAAMMLPGLLPVVRAVGLTSRWRRRQRAQAAHVLGFLAPWVAVSVVVLAPAAELLSSAAGPVAGSAALSLAALGQLASVTARALRAGHRLPSTGGTGWRADRTCALAGSRAAGACVLTCGPVMLALHVAGHDPLLLVVLTVVTTGRRVLVVRRGGAVAAVALSLLAGQQLPVSWSSVLL